LSLRQNAWNCTQLHSKNLIVRERLVAGMWTFMFGTRSKPMMKDCCYIAITQSFMPQCVERINQGPWNTPFRKSFI
jgi:hypothetical protein